MAQFSCAEETLVHEPQEAFHPGDGFPEDTSFLTTLNWVVKPERGLPLRPFDVFLYPEPLPSSEFSYVVDGELGLVGDRLELSLGQYLRLLNADDALCVTTVIVGAQSDEIYAIDAAGEEIPETRQGVNAPNGTAFIGPGICGLRATGRASFRNFRVFAVPPDFVRDNVESKTTVAPAIRGVTAYEQQKYLGAVLTVEEALQQRLTMDAYARSNTPSPNSRLLEKEIHRADPETTANRLLNTALVTQIRDHYLDILQNPSWSYDEVPQTGIILKTFPVQLLQILGSTDPVAATVLGCAVTIPVSRPFTKMDTLQQVYESANTSGYLPYPLIKVVGHHNDFGTGPDCQQFACLTFGNLAPTPRAIVGAARSPSSLDGPASTDIRILFERRFAGISSFVDQSDGMDKFTRDANAEITHYFATGSVKDRTENGLPAVNVGEVFLPFEHSEIQLWRVNCRDVFGRWREEKGLEFDLDPWPVQTPVWGALDVEYKADGTLELLADINWDWSKRTPFEIRLGLEITSTDSTEFPSPATGVCLMEENVDLKIIFSGATPELVPANTRWGIVQLPEYVADASSGGSGPSIPDLDARRYKLRLKLGQADDLFREESIRRLAVSADAWESVSGRTPDRRSIEPSFSSKTVYDPRPPLLVGKPWKLAWASRVDGFNLARINIDLSALTRDKVAGFHVWRAHESAIIDWALVNSSVNSAQIDSYSAEILAEREMNVRLSMIQGLVEPLVRKPQLERAFVDLFEVDSSNLSVNSSEIQISGAQNGLEFIMITAVSLTNVSTEKVPISNLLAIAVPTEPRRTDPLFRILRPDVGSSFVRSGTVIAAVGADWEFADADVRFFWDSNPDIISADEIMYSFNPIGSLTPTQLTSHASLANQVIERLPAKNWRFFAIRPPNSWLPHHFSVDIVEFLPISPAASIPTPRSPMQSLLLVPPFGPGISVSKFLSNITGTRWEVTLENVFEGLIPGMMECLVQLDIVADETSPPISSPIPFSQLVASGMAINYSGFNISASSVPGSSKIVILGPQSLPGHKLRLAASDPAGRIEVLFLETE